GSVPRLQRIEGVRGPGCRSGGEGTAPSRHPHRVQQGAARSEDDLGRRLDGRGRRAVGGDRPARSESLGPASLEPVRSGTGDHLFDDVIREAARGKVRVYLPLSLGRFERLPARARTGDGPPGAIGFALGRTFAQSDIDRLAGDALAGELADQRAVAFRTEARALLDPVLGEVQVVDVALRAELVDRAVDRVVVVPLASQSAPDLDDAARPGRQVLDGSIVRAAERLR